jgi:hypothetical protein
VLATAISVAEPAPETPSVGRQCRELSSGAQGKLITDFRSAEYLRARRDQSSVRLCRPDKIRAGPATLLCGTQIRK